MPFVDHVLAGSELFVRLTELEGAGVIDGVVFHSEPDCWRWWLGPSGERLVLKPDAFVRYGQGAFEHASFIEVDRASQSRTVIRRKGKTYVDYYHHGSEQHRLGFFPLVLFVTSNDARREQITDALSGLDAEDWHLFQVQTMAEAFTQGRSPPGQGVIGTG
jgi:hypothetical protein